MGDENPSGTASPANPPGWHPEEQNHRAVERKYWGRNNVLTAIAAIGGAASTILAFLALLNSQDAAQSSRLAVFEANRQAVAAEKQIKIAKDTAWRQLRAYIIDEIAETDALAPRIRNTGQTPAYNVTSWWNIDVLDVMNGRAKLDLLNFEDSVDAIRLDLGAQISISLPEETLQPGKKFGDFGPIPSGKSVFVWGVVYYRDVFERCQWKAFIDRKLSLDGGKWKTIGIQHRGTDNETCTRNDGTKATGPPKSHKDWGPPFSDK